MRVSGWHGLAGRKLIAAIALVLLGAMAVPLLLSSTQADAQESRRGWSLRELFQPRRPPRRLERIEELPGIRFDEQRRKPRKARAPRPVQPIEPEAPVVEKAPDAKLVIVIGDFLGSGLAEGLAATFADDPRVKILDRTSGSSGFVREEVANWPEKVEELIDAEKPDAIVAMIGANDRQQMRVGDKRETLGTEGWLREYSARATSFGAAVVGRKVPLVWVGLPAFKSPKASADMLAFNGVFKTASDDAGGEFVDVWEGFVDENGVYVSNGPGITGQPARLRTSDGINFTKAGKRKLAFYAEKPLLKVLGDAGAPGAQPGLIGPALPIDPATVPAIETTVPMALNDPDLDGGSELLGLVSQPRGEPRTAGEKLAIQGIAPEARPGRADDFSWPPRQPVFASDPAAKPAEPGAEKTTAITP